MIINHQYLQISPSRIVRLASSHLACSIIKLIVMSFFVQSQRKTGFDTTLTPSPGQYEHPSLSNSRRYAVAPFGSTQPLGRGSKTEKKKDSGSQRINKQFQEVFLVNDMNIKIKPQEQISSMFRSGTQRFNSERIVEEKPGPGQYNIKGELAQRAKAVSQSNSVHQFTLPTKPTVPSIPVDNLGFKEDDHNQMKKVQPPKPDPPHPGSYEISRALNSKGVVAWKSQKPIKKQTQPIPGPGDYSYQAKVSKSVSSCFHSSADRFGKIKKFREEKMPGPGQYNLEMSKKKSHNMSSESYFNSKTSRFHKGINDNSVGPGMYFNELNPRNKSLSMNTIRRMPLKEDNQTKVTNKKSIFQTQNSNPGPGQYRTNFGISYQLHKALLKKQTTDILPKEKRTVFQPKEEEYHPGPGAYEQETRRSQVKGKLWKKVQVVNLKGEEDPSPSPMDYPNFYNTIEAKVKQMNSKLTLTEDKPFNSGAQRFKHYSNPQTKTNYPQTQETQVEEDVVDLLKTSQAKKVKRLVMTTIKVRVPFGISSNKYEQKGQQYQGPDYYEKSIDWVKPSFNIRGKLQ